MAINRVFFLFISHEKRLLLNGRGRRAARCILAGANEEAAAHLFINTLARCHHVLFAAQFLRLLRQMRPKISPEEMLDDVRSTKFSMKKRTSLLHCIIVITSLFAVFPRRGRERQRANFRQKHSSDLSLYLLQGTVIN